MDHISNNQYFQLNCSSWTSLIEPKAEYLGESYQFNLPVSFSNEGCKRIPNLIKPEKFYNAQNSCDLTTLSHRESITEVPEEPQKNMNDLVDEILKKARHLKTRNDIDMDLNNLSSYLNKDNGISINSEIIKKAPKGKATFDGKGNEEKIQYGVKYRKEDLPNDTISVLKDFDYDLSYLPSKGPKRRKRVIHCKHPNCECYFFKTWNFLDHARMHLKIKPFK